MRLAVLEELLTRALRDDDDRVRLVRGEALLQRGEEAAGPFERELRLGDEAEVDDGVRRRRRRRDEAGVAPHELDEADAVRRSLRLDVREADDVRGRRDGRLEAEGAADELEVVVNRLGDADDGDLEPPFRALLGEVARAAERSVAADAEEDVDVHPHERVNHLLDGLLATRRTKDRAALRVDRVDDVGVEHDRLVAEARDQPRVAVADAVDRLDAVVEGEDLDETLDDVVETGAEAARRHDADARPRGVVENLGQGARAFEGRHVAEMLAQLVDERLVLRDEDAPPLADELQVAHGRVDLALAEPLDVARVFRAVRHDFLERRIHVSSFKKHDAPRIVTPPRRSSPARRTPCLSPR